MTDIRHDALVAQREATAKAVQESLAEFDRAVKALKDAQPDKFDPRAALKSVMWMVDEWMGHTGVYSMNAESYRATIEVARAAANQETE